MRGGGGSGELPDIVTGDLMVIRSKGYNYRDFVLSWVSVWVRMIYNTVKA